MHQSADFGRDNEAPPSSEIKRGDVFVCYLVKLSRWCGLLEVASDAFEDSTPIFADENDPFPIRFKVRPKVMLEFDKSIPVEELWSQLSFTNQLTPGAFGWAQAAKLRQSLVSMSEQDGLVIADALEQQAREGKRFELEASDLRHIGQRSLVRTEGGEVEVEIAGEEPAATFNTANGTWNHRAGVEERVRKTMELSIPNEAITPRGAAFSRVGHRECG